MKPLIQINVWVKDSKLMKLLYFKVVIIFLLGVGGMKFENFVPHKLSDSLVFPFKTFMDRDVRG